jgi:flagellar brake protein
MQPSFQDTQPAPLQTLTGHAIDEFCVGHPTEVATLLGQLIDASVVVHLSAPGGSYSTTVWTLDSHQRRISLSADANSPQLRALIDAGEATAVAYLDSIKLQFDLHHLVLVHGKNASALQAELPAVLYRFQRRSSFRVRTPARGTPTAQFHHPALPERLLSLRVLDVSTGGCALALPADVPPLAAGTRIAHAHIHLDGDTRFDTALALQHVSGGFNPAASGMRLGCAFMALDGAAKRALQCYIDQTQKRRRLLTLI